MLPPRRRHRRAAMLPFRHDLTVDQASNLETQVGSPASESSSAYQHRGALISLRPECFVRVTSRLTPQKP
jgi:hypothetical protein